LKKKTKGNEAESVLPRRVVKYIHETGIRALDHLAERLDRNRDETALEPLDALVGQWRAMDEAGKEQLIDRVATSVIAVVAASAALPFGLKLEKKVVRSVRKVIKRQKDATTVSAARKKEKKKLETKREKAKGSDRDDEKKSSKPKRKKKR
jgi:hypothetical protein